jgi:hypothetical protein
MGVETMSDLPGQMSLFGPQKTGREAYEEAERNPPIKLNSTVRPEDAKRLTHNAQRVLARLREGPATGPELLSPEIGGIGFKQRLHELKKSGIPYGKRHVRDGIYEYRLIGDVAGS